MNHLLRNCIVRPLTAHPRRCRWLQSIRATEILTAWAVSVAVLTVPANAQVGAAAPVQERVSVREAIYVTLGGIEQWITIRGDDMANPVILFLHGGPGSTLSPFADAMFGNWERDFTLVQWDQRGAGRTFGRQAPGELTEEFFRSHPLRLERMVADGIELAKHLVDRFGRRKIILLGTSWGSVLGARMAAEAPELFHAYVGHSQVVNPAAGLKESFQKVKDLAKAADDRASMELLAALGPPPYSEARKFGQLLRVIKRYEAKNSTAAPDAWWQWSPEYDNETDRRHRSEGDDYSFAHYVGHARFGIEPLFASIDFSRQATVFAIPVFLIQGEHDLLTLKESTRAWFDSIQAPRKGYHVVPNAVHDFNAEVVNQMLEVLKREVLR